MKFGLTIAIFLLIGFRSVANQNKGYVSSKEGITIFAEGDWDSVRTQKLLDNDLDFNIENLKNPNALKVFIVLGVYGPRVSYKHKFPCIFITTAFDSLTNTDTVYEELFGINAKSLNQTDWKFNIEHYFHPNELFPGNFDIVNPYLKGTLGLKISYYDMWDTVNYYNHLLSIVDYAVKHIEDIKSNQQRVCLPSNFEGIEISILTFDSTKLKAVPIKDWVSRWMRKTDITQINTGW